jgi:AcrR family transcriptional regulator
MREVKDVNMSDARNKKRNPAESANASRHYHHGDLPRALVGAARQLLEAHGLKHVTVRAACESIGVSIAAPYRHFGNREDLLAAVLAEAFSELELATQQAWASKQDPSQALVKLGVTYVRFASEHPNTYRAMFGGALDKRAYPALHAAGLRALGVLQQAVRAWLVAVDAGKGSERDGDEATVSLVAWSMAHGISTLALDGVLDATVGGSHELAEGLFTRVVDALTLEQQTSRNGKPRPRR